MQISHAAEQATEFKAISGQINVDEAQGIVECFVSGIGNKDSVGDVVLPGAFTESLKRRKPRVVWGHDWNHPIGKVLEIYEVGPGDRRLPAKMRQAGIGGLFARVQFNLKSEKGREAFTNVAFYGEEQEWSIGYKTLDAVYDNQRKANLLREVELYEVSPVLHGANQLTGTISIKSDQTDDETSSFGKSKWKMFDREFAARIKEDYPEIWKKGGNIKGNAQYAILTKIAEQGGVAKTADQINALELREAWVARHAEDFRLPGVIAQIKWLAVGSRGEDYMKNVVREAMKKVDERKKKDALESDLDDLESVAAEEKGGMGVEYRSLKEELAKRFGGPIRVREIRGGRVTFDHMHDGEPMTMRVGFRYIDGEWMFGEPEKVVVRTIYITAEDGDDEGGNPTMEDGEKPISYSGSPVDKDCGCGGKGGCGAGRPSDTMSRLRNILEMMKSEASEEIEQKAGRVISAGNLEKLQRAMEILQEIIAAGGRAEIEMKLRAPNEKLEEIKDFMSPVFFKYDAETSIENGHIAVRSIKGNVSEFKSAFNSAARIYAETHRGANLKVGAKPASFDPNARDADGDGKVQDSTPFERPSVEVPEAIKNSISKFVDSLRNKRRSGKQDERGELVPLTQLKRGDLFTESNMEDVFDGPRNRKTAVFMALGPGEVGLSGGGATQEQNIGLTSVIRVGFMDDKNGFVLDVSSQPQVRVQQESNWGGDSAWTSPDFRKNSVKVRIVTDENGKKLDSGDMAKNAAESQDLSSVMTNLERRVRVEPRASVDNRNQFEGERETAGPQSMSPEEVEAVTAEFDNSINVVKEFKKQNQNMLTNLQVDYIRENILKKPEDIRVGDLAIHPSDLLAQVGGQSQYPVNVFRVTGEFDGESTTLERIGIAKNGKIELFPEPDRQGSRIPAMRDVALPNINK